MLLKQTEKAAGEIKLLTITRKVLNEENFIKKVLLMKQNYKCAISARFYVHSEWIMANENTSSFVN